MSVNAVAIPLTVIPPEGSRGNVVSQKLLQSTIFPSYFHQSSMGRWVLRTFAGADTDLGQVARMKEHLKTIGGVIETVTTVDGQQIEVMRITQEAWCGKAPTERKVVVRFHPNVQYYTMEYDYLLRELRLGRDVVFFDSRGLSPTEFAPSEEGFYMDADAVYHKVRDEWGYLPQNTWITARCSGTTQAIYLRHRYQDDGFHMVLENPFERWSALIARQGWPLSSMGLSAMDSLRSQDPLTLAKAQEHGFDLYVDHFDNMRKLQAISKNLHHTRVVIISTLTDKLIGQGPADAVEAAAARTMEVYHLKYPGQDPAVDGHFEDVFSNSDIVTTYSELVT